MEYMVRLTEEKREVRVPARDVTPVYTVANIEAQGGRVAGSAVCGREQDLRNRKGIGCSLIDKFVGSLIDKFVGFIDNNMSKMIK